MPHVCSNASSALLLNLYFSVALQVVPAKIVPPAAAPLLTIGDNDTAEEADASAPADERPPLGHTS